MENTRHAHVLYHYLTHLILIITEFMTMVTVSTIINSDKGTTITVTSSGVDNIEAVAVELVSLELGLTAEDESSSTTV